jgi:Xaa-Pro aminopeptidase
MSVETALTPEVLERVRDLCHARGLDGWLLFDFHGLNPVATRVLGVGGIGTRRLFVYLPVVGRPVAIAHRVELARIEGFPGEVRPYAAWRELEQELARLLSGRTVAMEYSARDAVPYLDRVPAGVLELVRGAGARVVSSSDFVTDLAARWSPEELAGHRAAAAQLREIALGAFGYVGDALAMGAVPTESGVQRWVLEAMDRAGLHTSDPPIVAVGANAADPHHEPSAVADMPVVPGQVLLLDLWGGVAIDAVYADQTWMAFVGTRPPEEVVRVWNVVRDARDQVVAVLRDRWREGWTVRGADLDDAARKVVRAAGYEAAFVHRTGHSIDRDLHGSGPHLDNFETHDDRALAPGVGFSVEPGIYLPGRFGVRSEINVVLHAEGPEVTPEGPQQELLLLDVPGA